MTRVEGIARASAGDTSEMIAAIVAGFQPDTVPLVTSHRDGQLLGYLDGLYRDALDLHFEGHLDVDVEDIVARLRDDGVPVSIEAVEAGTALPGRTADGVAWLATKTHWRGVLRGGWALVGIALSDHPAAPGSMVRTALPATALPALYFRRDAETGRRTRWTDLDWQSQPDAVDR